MISLFFAAAAGLSLFNARPAAAVEAPADTGRPGRRYIIRGGSVMSMDPKVGDFAHADGAGVPAAADQLLQGLVGVLGGEIAPQEAAATNARRIVFSPSLGRF